MNIYKQDIGKYGEDLAVQFLKKKGYRILERNFHKRYAEIDIVAIDDDTLVFVEVKTRISGEFGEPLEGIGPWKQKALKRAALFYKSLHQELPSGLRIDAVAITLSPARVVEQIELVKNIIGG
ncbi:YraN family protein [Candidatus Microgenomates bacterium]|nr:YraN family protein [Candidatus Microgenomates bacterium]